MQRYIALLRGINISGKNKIAMPELKQGFAELGFCEVRTCLNSGNVVFSCAEADTCALSARIGAMIKDRFNLDIPVYTLPQERLRELLSNAPDWWGSADWRKADHPNRRDSEKIIASVIPSPADKSRPENRSAFVI